MEDSPVFLWIHRKDFRTQVLFKSTFISLCKERLIASKESRWVSESCQWVINATLEWVFARWREKKQRQAVPSEKIFPPQTCHCPLQWMCFFLSLQHSRLIFISVQHMPWNIYMFGYINKEKKPKTKQNKKTHTAHTHTHTHTHAHTHTRTHTQNGIVLLCFAFSVTQIVVIISLALQALSFILKAVFGIALHLTQFNK